MMLVWDNGTEDPYWHDTRTHKVDTAIALAKSAKFLVCIRVIAFMSMCRQFPKKAMQNP